MGIPDSFDPLMMLNTAKNVGEGGVPTGQEKAGSPLVERFDGAATNAVNIVIPGSEKPLSTPDGPQRQPEDVDRFNGGV